MTESMGAFYVCFLNVGCVPLDARNALGIISSLLFIKY